MRFSGLALELLEPLGGRGTNASVAQAPVGPSHLFSARARVSPGAGWGEHLSYRVEARVEGP
jgi:hypothetical protein